MSDWTGSERQRRPQLPCNCPKEFRGNQRFVSESEARLPTRLNFGRHKGQLLSEVPRDESNQCAQIEGALKTDFGR